MHPLRRAAKRKRGFEEDFDDKTVDSFLNTARISPAIDKTKLLKNLGCMTPGGFLTNAGVLFFAKDIDFLLNHGMVVCVL